MHSLRSPLLLFIALSLCAVALPLQTAHAYVSPYSSRLARVQQAQQGTSIVPTASSVTSLLSEEDRRIAVIAKAEPAVASVFASKDLPVLETYYDTLSVPGSDLEIRVPKQRQTGTERQVVSGGSAFFVTTDGLLLTNNHVVLDDTASYTVQRSDGQQLLATVVARDALSDIALLRVRGNGFPVLTLAASDQAKLGQTAIAIGNALGEYGNTVSVGVVSGLRRTVKAGGLPGGQSETLSELLQTDAAINEGNSGGPLLNSKGEVIGMNVALSTSGQNVSFALPVKALRTMLQRYQAGR